MTNIITKSNYRNWEIIRKRKKNKVKLKERRNGRKREVREVNLCLAKSW